VTRDRAIGLLSIAIALPAIFALPYWVRDDAPMVARVFFGLYIVIAAGAVATWLVNRFASRRSR
jgi:hypothetical protein